MLNRVLLMGRLTRDPELKYTRSSVPVCTVTLAVERDFADSNGVREADFIDVVTWRSTAEFVVKWFRKGLLVACEGRLQGRRWADKYGQNRVTFEVIADSVYFAERTEDRAPAPQRPDTKTPGTLPPKPVDAGRANVYADEEPEYADDLYRLPQSDYAEFDEDNIDY